MTVFGQRAAAPFQVHRGQIIEHQCPVVEVMPGQTSLNDILAFEQPVHGRVEIVLVALAKGERFGQRVAGGVGRQAAGSGQFRLGVEDACDDEGQHPVALRTVLRREGAVQSQLAQSAEHGGNMTVRQRTHDIEGLGGLSDGDPAFEQGSQALHESGGATW